MCAVVLQRISQHWFCMGAVHDANPSQPLLASVKKWPYRLQGVLTPNRKGRFGIVMQKEHAAI